MTKYSAKFHGVHVIGLCLVLLSGGAWSDVVKKDSNGFAIRIEHRFERHRPADVYQGLAQLPKWWSAVHSYSGDAENFSLDLGAGGCFCETWGQASVEHLRVIYAEPGKLVRLRGGLGPLQGMPVSGLMEWKLEPTKGDEKSTLLTWEYRVWGAGLVDLASIAGPVDQVLAQQFSALQAYIKQNEK